MVITLPATDAGTLVLNIAVPEAGTSIDVPITVTQQAITNVTPPTITGQGNVNQTLTATGGTWSVADPDARVPVEPQRHADQRCHRIHLQAGRGGCRARASR